jgi:hypothetical protein
MLGQPSFQKHKEKTNDKSNKEQGTDKLTYFRFKSGNFKPKSLTKKAQSGA